MVCPMTSKDKAENVLEFQSCLHFLWNKQPLQKALSTGSCHQPKTLLTHEHFLYTEDRRQRRNPEKKPHFSLELKSSQGTRPQRRSAAVLLQPLKNHFPNSKSKSSPSCTPRFQTLTPIFCASPPRHTSHVPTPTLQASSSSQHQSRQWGQKRICLAE